MDNNTAVIKLAAQHGNLTIIKNYTPASETINGVRVEVDFRTDEWQNLQKTVGFYRGNNSYGKLLTNGELGCDVPWEVLETDGVYFVNIVGVSENCTLTTNRVQLRINLGGRKDLIPSKEPTPTVYEQILGLLGTFDPSNYITLTNGLMNQQLMTTDPTSDMHIATKRFVVKTVNETFGVGDDGVSLMDGGKITEGG